MKMYHSEILSCCFALGAMASVGVASEAQTSLGVGDIAIVGFETSPNTSPPEFFSFLLLSDVSAGTTISFSDVPYSNGGFQNNNEGVVTWTAGSAGNSIGSIITVNSPHSTSISASSGMASRDSGSFNLSGSNDQILAFQGDSTSPTFLYGISFDSTEWSYDNSTDSKKRSTSDLPSSLALASGGNTSALSVGNVDRRFFDFVNNQPVDNSADGWRSAIGDSSNWISSGSGSIPSNVNVVPSPTAGLGVLSLMGITAMKRRRTAKVD